MSLNHQFWIFYQVQHFANNSLINGFFFPRCFSKFIILEIYCFAGFVMFIIGFCFFLSSIFFSVGLTQSNTERIFLANMSSTWTIPELAFTFDVMRYMDMSSSNSSFTVSIPLAFLIAL